MDVREIEIGKLLAHPKNANVMSKAVMAKVRRHIERTGRYEPLVVRPHPDRAGYFQLINGHHRKEILASLGYGSAACLVWELDDEETLMLLATINRLGGEDAAGKRLDLLESLATSMKADAAKLAAWLPEEEAALKKMLDEPLPQISDVPALAEMPEALTIFLKASDKKRVVEALRRIDGDLRRALLKVVLGE